MQGEFKRRSQLLVRPVGEAIVVECMSTRMQCDDPETADLGASLLGLVKRGHVQILLNLQGVDFASGSLLGSLVSLHLKAVKASGFFRLFGLEPVVRDALRICGLDTALEVYASEAEALSAHCSRPAAVESRTRGRLCGQ
jgi:anti-anti-sigma factor